MQKISLFIDQANIWSACKKMGKTLDYSKFQAFFEQKFSWQVQDMFYYQAFPSDGSRSHSIDGLHRFFVKMEKGFGYTVRKKELKTITLRDKAGTIIYDPRTGKPLTKEKGNFDVELTMDAMEYRSWFDIGIFFTGDSDFLPLITHLRNEWKKIYIFSTEDSISQELRTGADQYYNLVEFPEIHGDQLQSRQWNNPTQA